MNTTSQVKQAIKKSAQQLQQEPLELLKSAARQVTGEVPPVSTGETESMQGRQDEQNYKKLVAEQDGRRLQALESELKDIRRQKDALKAQTEAVETRNSQPVNNQLPELSLKRGRKMDGGQKGAAKRETTRVEKPVPPSG